MDNSHSTHSVRPPEDAADARLRIEAMQSEIEQLQAFIDKWASFPDEKTYIDRYIDDRSHFGCLFFVLALSASILGCVLVFLFVSSLTAAPFFTALTGVIAGYILALPLFFAMLAVRNYRLRKAARFQYTLDYGFYLLHHHQVDACRRKIAGLENEISVIECRLHIFPDGASQ